MENWNKEKISMYVYLANILPIEQIIEIINNNKIRGCDIKWLDDKLHILIKDAIKFAKFDVSTDRISPPDFPHYNEYVKEYYLSKFTVLLNFFKDFRLNINQ